MRVLFLTILMSVSTNVMADAVKVIDAKLVKQSDGIYRVDVTLEHGDTGWKHYADNWEVLDENKQLMARRVLYHPHVNEQPFTRSLSDVKIPAGQKFVYIRGHDKVHGYGESKKFLLK